MTHVDQVRELTRQHQEALLPQLVNVETAEVDSAALEADIELYINTIMSSIEDVIIIAGEKSFSSTSYRYTEDMSNIHNPESREIVVSHIRLVVQTIIDRLRLQGFIVNAEELGHNRDSIHIDNKFAYFDTFLLISWH